MATTFGWKKKIPHDLSRKRASAFDDNEQKDDAIKGETSEQHLYPAKRLHSENGNETASKISEHLRNEGAALAETERFSEAVKKWNEALILTPDDEKLYEMKSQIFLQLDKTFEAIKCAEKAVQLKPTWPAAHQALGRAQLKLGEFDLAVKSFSKAVHLQPDDSELWNEDLLWSVDIREKAHEHDRGLEIE